ncbi:sulfatase family protein [Pontiella sulfatireligans]|uniref:Arylsulfatase n=1 Tax=Pontiella sulfatireligans TaxID=2750658 RepID=A0A6C2UKA2_9BACT|nr:arylsulfatase [Pontiella sulfatireligans]SPS74431.1 sulfatase S1_15 [Kiritimatiellales bacterium]VGO20662.1 Arylsulfatase [Pontiella sulfatireligans]
MKQTNLITVLIVFGAVLALHAGAGRSPSSTRPNILLIYTDDVGYGDISCQGATGVKTPNIDRIAREGLSFPNGHCAASTCTPSRYSLLTGEYSFRNDRAQILQGDAPALIKPGTFTLADVMKRAGYATGVVGKWHLGLGDGNLDWNGDIKPGPLEIGFDSSFIIPATLDRTPCVFLDNHRIYKLDPADPVSVSYDEPLREYPIGSERPDLLKQHPSHGHDQTIVNGISRIGYMSGGKSALWKDENIADVLSEKACAFIDQYRNEPFFLYFASGDIHVPRCPNPRFRGQSSMGLRGDAIVQLDWCVGQLLNKLDELNLADDTLVIFTGDNGPVLDDGYQDQAVEKVGDHRPNGDYRGGKASRYEGATRVPFLVRWPKMIGAGTTSDALVVQMDFAASFAAMLGVRIPEGECRDSESHLGALLGKKPDGRAVFVEAGIGGLTIIQDGWKYIEPGRITDWITTPYEWKKIGMSGELYHLQEDPQEKYNRADRFPEKVESLKIILQKVKGE